MKSETDLTARFWGRPSSNVWFAAAWFIDRRNDIAVIIEDE